MVSIELKCKEDVNSFKELLREASFKRGIRLGKNNKKVEAIMAELFGCENFHTLVVKATSGES